MAAPAKDGMNVSPKAGRHISYTGGTANNARGSACNECKQQKLRCDLASIPEPFRPNICARCKKLDLECKVDDTFKRTRKRRTSYELEKEVRELRNKLNKYEDVQDNSENGSNALQLQSLSTYTSDPVPTPMLTGSEDVSANPLMAVTTPLTTVPSIELPQEMPLINTSKPRPRSLASIQLSIHDIDELFQIFFLEYHPHLPFLDPDIHPSAYYESCELLFWAIISVAARRYQHNPTLLPQLSRHVSELVWKQVRILPSSKGIVQSLVLFCSWPFPTSSTATDTTYLLSGIMIQIGTQLGLNRSTTPEDFTKYPVSLTNYEYAERVRTWAACCIAAHSVSVGCGLPCTFNISDWSLGYPVIKASSSEMHEDLKFHLRIEKFRNRVNQALTTNPTDAAGVLATADRLPFYRLLEQEFFELQAQGLNKSPSNKCRLSAAKTHLYAFAFFDEADSPGFEDRILRLYTAAYNQIEITMDRDRQGGRIFETFPFFSYQNFVVAPFVLLKILSNSYFKRSLNENDGRKMLRSSISALRRMSVANNDLPGRLSDVIAYFLTLPNPEAFGGTTPGDLKVSVRTRLSQSIVYDSLWIWRRNFGRQLKPREDEPFDVVSQFMDIEEFNHVFGFNASADFFAWRGSAAT